MILNIFLWILAIWLRIIIVAVVWIFTIIWLIILLNKIIDYISINN